MSFEKIAHQQGLITFVQAAFRAQRLASAYLLISKEPSHALQVVREMAKLVNCESGGDSPCDSCEQCKKIDQDNHVDVHWYKPEKETITIAQVRDLERYCYLRPYEAKKKVFVICGAECLNEESSNALLKTLEEPPLDSLLILIASDAAMLLPTIVSRCQKLIVTSLDETMVKHLLMHEYKVPLLQAHLLSYLSGGNLEKALALKAANVDVLEKRRHILSAVESQKFSLLSLEELNVKNAAQKRKSLHLLLDILLSWFRDVVIVKSNLSVELVNVDKKEQLLLQKDKYSFDELVDMMTAITTAKSLIDLNMNVKVVMSKMRADLWKEHN